MYRLLVSGSRNFQDYWQVDRLLWRLRGLCSDLVVVHGDCPSGADRIARSVCQKYGITQEPYPADWNKYGKAAGFIRNQVMVDTRPDYAWFFPKGKSNGTKDCYERVVKAGILHHVYGEFE